MNLIPAAVTRSYAAYALIWCLFLAVTPARVVVVEQFRRLPTALRGVFWLGLACGTLLVLLDALLMVHIDAYAVTGAWRPGSGAVVATVLWATTVSVTEEMIVRGLLLTRFRQVVRGATAVLLTAAIFAVMHVGRADFNGVAVVQYFLDGLLLGWMVLITGSIWVGTGVHLAKNLCVALLFGASKRLVEPLLLQVPASSAATLVPAMDLLAYVAVLPFCLLLYVRASRPGRTRRSTG